MKIAIVGAGIVGSTAAYYLSKEKDVEVTVFDHGLGQATKAAAGIISPWFSKRRNKAWYRMASLGADFYQDLVSDLENDGYGCGLGIKEIQRAVPMCIGLSSFQIDGVKNENCNCWCRYRRFNG